MPAVPSSSTARPLWETLPFNADIMLEASAGTGKTFTLENIVRTLVLRPDNPIPIDKLLLVTFTEKAVGDLRDRIRSALQSARAEAASDAVRSRLDDALRGLPSATISTIHSFCQKILREHAYENGLPLVPTVVGSTADQARRAVLAALRSPGFAALGPEALRACLALPIPASPRTIDGLVESLASTLTNFRGDAWDFLIGYSTPPDGTPRPSPATSGEEASNPRQSPSAANLIALVQSLLAAIPPATSLWDYILAGRTIRRNAKAQGEWDAIETTLRTLADDPSTLQAACHQLCVDFSAPKFNPLVRTGSPERILDGLEWPAMLSSAARAVLQASLRWLFADARRRYDAIIRDEGLLSFDNMILHAAAAISDPLRGPALVSLLRNEYHVALVDEFQDTDAVQWDIFRRVFSSDAPGQLPGHFLIVVGDPKQSIYRFRGADIGTYLEASGQIATHQTLSLTFRSTHPLTDAFNTMFAVPGWFGGAIPYPQVNFPDGNKRYPDSDLSPEAIAASDAPAAWSTHPVLLLESCPPPFPCLGKPSDKLATFLRAAAAETLHLLSLSSPLPIRDRDGNLLRRHLVPSDFAVLVLSHNHAALAKRIFNQAGLPSTIYQERGLYASPEAEELAVLLDFLAAPSLAGTRAAALLTPFFGASPAALYNDSAAAAAAALAPLDHWLLLARERKWGILFDSILRSSALTNSSTVASDPDFDRRFASVSHILDDLLTKVAPSASTPADFSKTLRAWRARDIAADENGNLQPLESDDPRVRILTIHAAKGLEWPIVFLAAGLSPPRPKKPNSIVRPLSSTSKQRFRVSHLDGRDLESNDLALATGEIRQELSRLYYVAATRAKYKLYIPWSAQASAPIGIGSKNSPLYDGFLATAVHALLVQHRATLLPAPPQSEKTPPGRSTAAPPSSPSPPLLPVRLSAPPPSLARLKLRWDSFSTLNRAHSAPSPASPLPALDASAPLLADEAPDAPAPEDSSPAPTFAPASQPDMLPANRPNAAPATPLLLLPPGTLTGTVFHELMQALANAADTPSDPGFSIGLAPDFDALWNSGRSPAARQVYLAMRRNALPNRTDPACPDETSAKQLLRMAWTALRTPLHLDDVGGPPTLSALPPADRKAEVNFVVNEPHLLQLASTTSDALNGSIDLLFRVAGRYFILDWKSNQIAEPAPLAAASPASPYASQPLLHQKMLDSGYHLQAQLYKLAAEAWLAPATVAAAVYLFVRGGALPGGTVGVYRVPSLDTTSCRTAVQAAILASP